jgi:carbon storage regulator CsrA
MLVLSRKQGESICLPGENVTITILRLSHGRVSVGISAPDEIVVMRSELVECVSETAAECVALQAHHV